LTLGACGGATKSQRTETTAPHTDSSSAQAAVVLGTWVRGQDRLVLDQAATYLWEREQSCDLPPCLIDQMSGTYAFDGASLHLTTVEGPDLVLATEVRSDPRRLTLRHPDGRTWTLPFVE
jgi:hypothetical protein